VARIRSIKPEFFTSGQVVECSTNARLLFVGSWVFCDDKGRHPLSFKRLKMEVYPGDDFTNDEIESMFNELWKVGLVTVYQHGGERFFCVNGWSHQKIDRPQPPKYPAPSEGSVIPFIDVGSCQFDEHSTNARRTLATDRKGYDGIGGDGISHTLTPAREAEPGTAPAPLRTWSTPPGCSDELTAAIDRWQGWRASIDGRPTDAIRLEAMLTEARSKGWTDAKIAKAIGFSISKDGKSWLDPELDFQKARAVNGTNGQHKPQSQGLGPIPPPREKVRPPK